ncbi:MAG: D-glycero-alpha-D-manno-heptose-1,7-bisphosphate 7-phosphatase [Bacteriovoracales bacterium]
MKDLVTFVLGDGHLEKILSEMGFDKIFFVKSREQIFESDRGKEPILYLELPDGLNFDLTYFLKFAKENSIGLFYNKNFGDDLFLIDQDFEISKIKDPDSSIYDGFFPCGAFLCRQGSLKEFFAGRFNSFKGIPLGKNKDYQNFKKLKKALFLDRDGIINVDLGYLYQPEKALIYEGIIPLIKAANKENMPVIVLTNQSGVAKGWYNEEDILTLHDHLQKEIDKLGGRVDGWFYSPFHPEEGLKEYKKKSLLRKPGPGMALLACELFPIDLSKSFMIGDKLSDNLQVKGLNCINLKRDYDLTGARFPVCQSYEEILDLIFN